MGKKCSKCGSNKDTIKVVKVIDGKRQQVVLCAKCLNSSLTDEQLGAVDTYYEDFLKENRDEYSRIHCNNCGMSWADVLELGYLGCEHCYEYMGDKIHEALKLVQGTTENRQEFIENRNPCEVRMSVLKLKLKEAVAREDFESAARIRDQLSFKK